MRMRTVVVVAVLTLAACSNGDAELQRSTRADCASIQPGTTTLREAETLMHDAVVVFGNCRSGLNPFDTAAACGEPAASVCTIRLEWLSNDCSSTGGCAYVCEVRTADVANGNQPPLDTPICASRYLTHQAYYY